MSILQRIAKLFEVKSIVTIAMTACMVMLVSGQFNPPESVLSLYSISYGAIMAYFFTRPKDREGS